MELRRQTALDWNLGRNLPPGYQGPWWTAEEVALLGVLSDEEAARKLGKSSSAVRQKREELGIPNPEDTGRWTTEEVGLLGTVPDREVAARTGRTPHAITQKRIALGIPNPVARPGPYGRAPWTAEEDALVRSLPPAEAAARTGRSKDAVYTRRHQLGVTGRRRRGEGGP